jgi:O-antigen/teichoic acid export membrane protein
LATIWQELYQVVVGKFYSPATLGQYTRAKQFSQLFSNNLTTVIQRVTYPVLSNIQDDNERMVSAYRRIIKTTMLITAISMFLLGAISEPLLYCLIGPKWHEAATYLPLICISGALYPLHAINLNMLQVQGRSDLFLVLEIIKKIFGLIPLAFCIFWGVLPMLYVNLFVGVLNFFLNSYYSGKLINYNSWMQIRDIAPSFGIAGLISIIVYFFKYLPLSNWIVLPLQFLMGVGIFIFVCTQIRIKEYLELKSMIKPYFKRIGYNLKKEKDLL